MARGSINSKRPPSFTFQSRNFSSTCGTSPVGIEMPLQVQPQSAPQIPERSSLRQSSLRRLSSLASLHQLNPFTRRQSHNATEDSSETPSNTSSSSLLLRDYQSRSSPIKHHSMAAFYQPTLSHTSDKVRLRVTASQDPQSFRKELKLPKSRTYSNLPLPAKEKQSSSLPKSQSSVLLPPSRIPTPSGNRRESRSRLVSTSRSILKSTRNSRLQRSDTEPLLPHLGYGGSSGVHRATAFKENISLSPIKSIPSLDISRTHQQGKSFHLSPTSDGDNDKFGSSLDAPDALSASFAPLTRQPQRFALRDAQSSPIRKLNGMRRPYTPPALGRGSSQPVLSEVSNSKRVSFGADIKQQRLLSAKQAPTPPLPRTPSNATPIIHQRLKSANNSGAIRKEVELSPCSERSTPRPTTYLDPDKVTTGQAISYWCGRFTALDDRYRNDHLLDQAARGTVVQETDDDKIRRMKRVLVQLYGLCVTDEAKRTLQTFHTHLKANGTRNAAGDEEVMAAFVTWDEMIREDRDHEKGCLAGAEDGGTELVDGPSISGLRKMRFMERLLGKTRRSLN